jgi:hypothetical protein
MVQVLAIRSKQCTFHLHVSLQRWKAHVENVHAATRRAQEEKARVAVQYFWGLATVSATQMQLLRLRSALSQWKSCCARGKIAEGRKLAIFEKLARVVASAYNIDRKGRGRSAFRHWHSEARRHTLRRSAMRRCLGMGRTGSLNLARHMLRRWWYQTLKVRQHQKEHAMRCKWESQLAEGRQVASLETLARSVAYAYKMNGKYRLRFAFRHWHAEACQHTLRRKAMSRWLGMCRVGSLKHFFSVWRSQAVFEMQDELNRSIDESSLMLSRRSFCDTLSVMMAKQVFCSFAFATLNLH